MAELGELPDELAVLLVAVLERVVRAGARPAVERRAR